MGILSVRKRTQRHLMMIILWTANTVALTFNARPLLAARIRHEAQLKINKFSDFAAVSTRKGDTKLR